MKHAYRNLWKEAAGSGRKVKRCKTKMTGEGVEMEHEGWKDKGWTGIPLFPALR